MALQPEETCGPGHPQIPLRVRLADSLLKRDNLQPGHQAVKTQETRNGTARPQNAEPALLQQSEYEDMEIDEYEHIQSSSSYQFLTGDASPALRDQDDGQSADPVLREHTSPQSADAAELGPAPETFDETYVRRALSVFGQLGSQRWNDAEPALRTCGANPRRFLENLAMRERQRRGESPTAIENKNARDNLKYRGRA